MLITLRNITYLLILLSISACNKKIDLSKKSTRTFDTKTLLASKYQDFFENQSELDYEKLLAFRNAESEPKEGLQKRHFYDILSLLESYLGNYSEAIKIYDKARLQPTDMMVFDSLGNMTKSIFYPKAAYSNFPDSLFSKKYDRTFLKAFVQNLKKDEAKVFAINELHPIAYFRKTVYDLLPILKTKGYKYLALESLFFDKQAQQNIHSEPRKALGFYNHEVTLGDIIRRAKSLDFELISYDAQGTGSQVTREELSYKNIIDRTLAKDPSAKIILFAGASHVSEGKIGRIKNLGYQFKENGIDPLTITQTKYYERNVPETIKEPTIFRNTTSMIDGRFDYLLVLPKTTYSNKRPSWLWEMGRKPIKVDARQLKKVSPPFIIEAYRKNESHNAVPFDRIEVSTKSEVPPLALKNGKYRINVISSKNERYTFQLNVK